jgi:hypothetical protein
MNDTTSNEPSPNIRFLKGKGVFNMAFRFLTRLAAVVGMAASLASAPRAVAQITLTNPNFELPGTVKTEYWDELGNIVPGRIPGWEPTGPGVQCCGGPTPGPGDSGVEFGGTAGGAWQGFLAAQDPAIYNTTTHNIIAGRHYRAQFNLRDIFTSVGPASMQATLYYVDAGSNRVPLGTPSLFVPTGGFTLFSILLTPAEVAPGLGRPVGIEFDNVTNGNIDTDSWFAIDNVALGATAANSADVNIDGAINLADYAIIRDHLEQAAAPWSNGDVDGSGFVDLNDFRAWTTAAPPEIVALIGVPEPATTTLALVMAAGGLRFARRRVHGVVR